uniref:Uncharacterized protein n=1 Tax=Anopheles arabiensis TaxID=7173 RepID=A0A1I8JT14_ANOAR
MRIALASPCTILLAAATTLLCFPLAYGLECYTCSTDSSDVDCDNLAVLEKTSCQPFSATNHPVQPVCGYKRLLPTASEAPQRIWRGCAVSGECALLSRQGNEAFSSAFRMSTCEECEEDDCNGPKSGATRSQTAWWTVGLLTAVKLISTKGWV